jgi:iron complex outermembrane receptor protein
LRVTAGIAYDDLDEGRRGYLNFDGATLGVKGALRRDQGNQVYDLDEYLQAQWSTAAHWTALAGLRHSLVSVTSTDHLASDGVPPVSSVSYNASNPVAGLTYRITPRASAYLAYGRGFETPTLNDLAYRSVDGSLPGLNLGLHPARSDNLEVGFKAAGDGLRLNLAGFRIDTRDELAVLQNSGGRAVYQNIGVTRRTGAELELEDSLARGLTARLAYTWLRAFVADPYTTCVGLPCVPTLIPSGSQLPAVPAQSLYAALHWHPDQRGLTVTLEAIGRARIYANDPNSQSADGYWIGNLSAGVERARGAWLISAFARVDNFTNHRYVGSVIVNESNGRYFEPGPGRAAYLIFSAAHRT